MTTRQYAGNRAGCYRGIPRLRTRAPFASWRSTTTQRTLGATDGGAQDCPAVGVATDGRTREEALEMVKGRHPGYAVGLPSRRVSVAH